MSVDSMPRLCFGTIGSSYSKRLVIFFLIFFLNKAYFFKKNSYRRRLEQLSNHLLLPQYEIRKKLVSRKLNFGTRSTLNVIVDEQPDACFYAFKIKNKIK